MKQLKIKIWNEENVVLMKVLQQDETLRGKGVIYKASNGRWIESYQKPGLEGYNIRIKGTIRNLDGKIGDLIFSTTREAEECVKMIREAVEEYNKSIRGVLYVLEKKYLRATIEPFRNEVKYIIKSYSEKIGSEFIKIAMLDGKCTTLHYFETGTLYKGMEPGREYTLEELGL